MTIAHNARRAVRRALALHVAAVCWAISLFTPGWAQALTPAIDFAGRVAWAISLFTGTNDERGKRYRQRHPLTELAPAGTPCLGRARYRDRMLATKSIHDDNLLCLWVVSEPAS